MFARRLYSIRTRFTVLIALVAAAATVLAVGLDAVFHLADWPLAGRVALVLIASVVPGVIAYALTGRLTRPLEALRRSAEALAAGSTGVPIDIDSRCEVGGLAAAFRKMVERFNSNVLRMNVLAYSDAVTHMANRAALRHVLTQAAGRGRAFEAAVIFVDLDNFKHVNDTLGHDAGDQLLRKAAERMLWTGFQRTPDSLDVCISPLGEVRSEVPDLVFARFAGDEFVVLVPGLVEEGALAHVAGRIVESLAKPFVIGGVEVSIGASAGIARMPYDSSDADEVVSFADLAMYAAKRGGKNRFAFFDGALREEARARARMEAEVRGALDREDLFLEFQPKLRTSDLALHGVEALVRIRTAGGETVPPGAFIEIAEGCGLIERIGQAVLRKAVDQAVLWQRAGRPVRVAINASPIQFAQSGFADHVIAVVRAAGLDPTFLEIEVTESTAMRDVAATARHIGRLRAAGIHVAIDDFGNGYSNISQLVQLPYDVLKIDRSLVWSIGRDRRGEMILEGILSMARGLGHVSVAEGVETQAQVAFLKAKGCNVLQGFFFARPMSGADLDAWMETRQSPPDLGWHRLKAV